MTTPMSCSMRTMVVPKLSRAALHELRHLGLLGGGHAGHRLVEQQKARVGDERARKFDPLLQAIGQGAATRS